MDKYRIEKQLRDYQWDIDTHRCARCLGDIHVRVIETLKDLKKLLEETTFRSMVDEPRRYSLVALDHLIEYLPENHDDYHVADAIRTGLEIIMRTLYGR